MHHCFLTESLPQWSLFESYYQVGINVDLINNWAEEVPVGITLIVSCLLAGLSDALSNCCQDLLLSNRMWSNSAKQWLPANGCAHAALFHKDIWVQCALIFLTDFFPTADFDFTCLFKFCTSFFSLYSQACQSAVLIYMPLQQLPRDCMCHIYYS